MICGVAMCAKKRKRSHKKASERSDLYTKHKAHLRPYKSKDGRMRVMYDKLERTDDFYFYTLNTVTVNCVNVNQCDRVTIRIPHRNVVITASAADIKNHKMVKTFYREAKYHLPIDYWKVRKGDKNWVKRLLRDCRQGRLKLKNGKKVS
jgi:hypothetical protein